MADNSDSDESTAMLLRRVQNVETVSSDIALRLAEMLFIRHYSQEHTNEQPTQQVTGCGWLLLIRSWLMDGSRPVIAYGWRRCCVGLGETANR